MIEAISALCCTAAVFITVTKVEDKATAWALLFTISSVCLLGVAVGLP